ncbi:hypothetical protein [Halomonas sp. LBP4]|uniref:hypothetical protein n=1 Tax=Halomonas sp. LBP4 TaxID=2044917 RepID=UPI000D76941A|nr:hypothetical protein [Halomonas sp. LBP4]PXX95853.1 hypothetical protein CR157_16775 [Halomonas sp. LBP4]
MKSSQNSLAQRVMGTGGYAVTPDLAEALNGARQSVACFMESSDETRLDNYLGARMAVSKLVFSSRAVQLLEGVEMPVPNDLVSWGGPDPSSTWHQVQSWCSGRLLDFAGVTYPDWRIALSAPDGLKRLTGLMALIDELPEEMLDLKQFDGDCSGFETLRKAMRREAVSLVASKQHLVHILELWDAAVTALPGDDAIAA